MYLVFEKQALGASAASVLHSNAIPTKCSSITSQGEALNLLTSASGLAELNSVPINQLTIP